MMGDQKKYRVGIIGHTGRGNYGHGLDRVWEEVERAEVIAVADPHYAEQATELRRLLDRWWTPQDDSPAIKPNPAQP